MEGNHPPLPNNRTGSLKRLENLATIIHHLATIIQDQLNQGIIERTDEAGGDGKEFYILHKAVVREKQKPQRCASCMTLQHGKVQVQPHSTSAWK